MKPANDIVMTQHEFELKQQARQNRHEYQQVLFWKRVNFAMKVAVIIASIIAFWSYTK